MNPLPTQILLVEDNLAATQAFQNMLLSCDSFPGNLHCARTFYDGLKVLTREKIDVVLLDIHLPDSTGLNALIHLRGQLPNIPVILLTSFDDPELAREALEQGAEDYLVKGELDSRILQRTIRHAIEKAEIRHQMHESERQYQSLVENIPGAVCRFRLGEDRTLIHVSSRLDEITGYPSDYFLDNRVKSYSSIIFTEDALRVANSVEKAIEKGNRVHLVYRIQTQDGSIRWIREQGSIVQSPDKKETWMDVSIFDITVTTRIRQQLHHLSHYDPVTHLPNRVLFRDRLKQSIARARREKNFVGLLYLGLDLFERVNETLGHHAGDQLLQDISERLKRKLYDSDTLTRIGGDEFCVLLPGLGQMEDMGIVLKKIFECFKEPFHVFQNEVYMTCSVGIGYYPAHCEDGEELLKQAHIAMHHAKQCGRNGYRLYSPSMARQTYQKFSLQNDLRHALERRELQLKYQPMVDIRTGKISAAEVLLRWNHPRHGEISPAEFIPLAEETGLITNIGRWVLEEACLQNKDWQRKGLPPIRLAVNISARQFEGSHLVEHVECALRKSGMDSECLELELTEGLIMKDVEESLLTLKDLKSRGVQISIDDFGTGHSSLGQLKRFPIDTLKIDRTFIRDLDSCSDDAAIAKAIISMANHMKLKVVAEGVETKEQLCFLQAHKCHTIQGFIYSKPIPAQEFFEFFNSDYQPKSFVA